MWFHNGRTSWADDASSLNCLSEAFLPFCYIISSGLGFTINPVVVFETLTCGLNELPTDKLRGIVTLKFELEQHDISLPRPNDLSEVRSELVLELYGCL